MDRQIANGVSDQKCHVPHFSCLNLGNGMVPLLMWVAAYDPDDTDGIKLPKCHVASYFELS